MNPGYDPEEIALLIQECKREGRNFIYVEDEIGEESNDEHAHVQFIGQHRGQDVIYDALIYTLRLHHSMVVYDTALEKVKKEYPDFVAEDEEDEKEITNPERQEDAEILLTEIIEELEENEEVKVKEHVEIDHSFEYGIGLEVGLNKQEIDEKVITDFIARFKSGKLNLDNGVYSFKNEEDEYGEYED